MEASADATKPTKPAPFYVRWRADTARRLSDMGLVEGEVYGELLRLWALVPDEEIWQMQAEYDEELKKYKAELKEWEKTHPPE